MPIRQDLEQAPVVPADLLGVWPRASLDGGLPVRPAGMQVWVTGNDAGTAASRMGASDFGVPKADENPADTLG